MVRIRKGKLTLLIIVTIIATLAAAFVGFYAFTSVKDMVYVPKDDYALLKDMGEKYSKLYNIQNTINERYLGETDEEAQMNAIYEALMNSLNDKYAAYFDATDYEKLQRYVNGYYVGIGVELTEDSKGRFVVKKTTNGGPAASELKSGDIILAVDGETHNTMDGLRQALRGEEGSKVIIKYERSGKKKEAVLVRSKVDNKTVYSSTISRGDDEIGYIRITTFENTTSKQFRTELADMENKGVKGLILDLRGNPGGVLEQAIDVADMLLPECTITHTEDRSGEKEYYNSDSECTGLRYVILVDKDSASASEVIAAAVKGNKGGFIVGTVTYGKGIVQQVLSLNDGTGIRLTTQKYLSPEDEEIQGVGITPDYTVKQPAGEERDLQLEKAIKLLS